jgi:hypothetical protein
MHDKELIGTLKRDLSRESLAPDHQRLKRMVDDG